MGDSRPAGAPLTFSTQSQIRPLGKCQLVPHATHQAVDLCNFPSAPSGLSPFALPRLLTSRTGTASFVLCFSLTDHSSFCQCPSLCCPPVASPPPGLHKTTPSALCPPHTRCPRLPSFPCTCPPYLCGHAVPLQITCTPGARHTEKLTQHYLFLSQPLRAVYTGPMLLTPSIYSTAPLPPLPL